ncbi:recombinase RecT [Neiella marina]|uniref:Recombinase RecT n=1 Tax=Neiella holothuriorum TaxID=2870530 RepID=A0ABS7EHF4_9GAMM|nr:recombinase RecT [Neiella holothuriorum]MBW8191333.1 recombinase RecT [Neiella holothuriorum]
MIPSSHAKILNALVAGELAFNQLYNNVSVDYSAVYAIGEHSITLAEASPDSLERSINKLDALSLINETTINASLRVRVEPFSKQIEVVPELSTTALLAPLLNCELYQSVVVELIFDDDEFVMHGPREPVEHSFDTQQRTGNLNGGYVQLCLVDGGTTVITMSPEEINAAVELTISQKYGDVVPFRSAEDYHDFMKCCVLRRAFNSIQSALVAGKKESAADDMSKLAALHNDYFEAYKERSTVIAQQNKQLSKRRFVINAPSKAMEVLSSSMGEHIERNLKVVSVTQHPQEQVEQLVEPDEPIAEESSGYQVVEEFGGW